MSEATMKMSRRQRFQRLFSQNPVTVKELRGRMRGARGFIILTVYLMLLSGFIVLIYASYAASANQTYGPDPRQAGKPIFTAVLGIQVMLVLFLSPSFTTAAISGEKERQTYDLLRTTLLPARSLVLGKLLSALGFVLLLILAAIPLQSIAFLLGGVSPLELFVSQLLLIVSAVAFSMIGLFFSALLRSTLASSVTTFATTIFIVAGIPAVALMFGGLFSTIYYSMPSRPSPIPSWVVDTVLAYGGMLLAATNLPASMVVSDLLLLQQGEIFFLTETFGGRAFYIPSPWWVYIILYSLLALVLYWLTVRMVRRIPVR